MEEITLVVPLYNEEHRWDSAYWQEMLQVKDVTWLFVDDGSIDGTHNLASRFCATHGATFLSLQGNMGKANALRAGMLHSLQADPTAVGFIDGDGAFSPRDVEMGVSEFKNKCFDATGRAQYDSIWSSRVALAGRNIDRRATRHFLGRAIATLIAPGLPEIPYDTQCGFKIFRASDQLRSSLSAPFHTRWFFDVELLQRWIEATGEPMRVWEIPLLEWRDVPGSKISGFNSLAVAREIAYVTSRNLRLLK